MRPFVKDEHGTVRFKKNAIVRYFVTETSHHRPCDSLTGYHELSFISDEAALAATDAARKQFPEVSGCRDGGCPLHTHDPERSRLTSDASSGRPRHSGGS